MWRARQLGYTTLLVYIGTDDPAINVERIARRVRETGHDVPEEDVRRRYERSLTNLPRAIALSDRAHLIDNTTRPREFAVYEREVSRITAPIPRWGMRILS